MLDTATTLSNLTCKELRELIAAAQSRLKAKAEEELQEARDKIQAIIEETGIDLKELLPKRGRKRRTHQADDI